jgi:hypothetical protein
MVEMTGRTYSIIRSSRKDQKTTETVIETGLDWETADSTREQLATADRAANPDKSSWVRDVFEVRMEPLASPAPKLHQQLCGSKAVELDHARDLAFAWHGGAEVLAIRCSDGSIMERYTLDSIGVTWTFDEASLKGSVKAALRALSNPLPVIS